MDRTGKRTIVHCPRGILRRSEAPRGVYGCFPSVDSSGLSAEFTNLGEGYDREINGTKTHSGMLRHVLKPNLHKI